MDDLVDGMAEAVEGNGEENSDDSNTDDSDNSDSSNDNNSTDIERERESKFKPI